MWMTPARWKIRTRVVCSSLAVALATVLMTLPAAPVTAAAPPPPAPKPAAPASPALELASPSAVVMEAGGGQVVFAKEPHQRRHPASVTKVMTLVLALDAVAQGKIKLTDTVTVSAAASSLGGTTAFLETGETVTLADLLKAVAVGSANDASVALAEHIAGSHEQFVALMNDKARELGMADTQFRNATGFDDDGHFTSAYDVAIMSRYAIGHHPELLKLTAVFLDEMPHPGGRKPTELYNRNKLVRFYRGADGLKTGWTQAAGYSVTATARREGTRIIAVILGAPRAEVRQEESWKLLDLGFAHFTSVNLGDRQRFFGSVPVLRGQQRQVNAVPRAPFVVAVPKADRARVQMTVQLPPHVRAPVSADQVLGQAIATVDGREVGKVDLLAATAVAPLSPWAALWRSLGQAFSLRPGP